MMIELTVGVIVIGMLGNTSWIFSHVSAVMILDIPCNCCDCT